ncbi:MAG: class I SAM-dependent methyltransferase [Candidatus Hodarchaeota archaeon]
MKKEDIEKMKTLKWYHKIDLGNGIITPGRDFDHLWLPLKREMRKVDFANKRILDIGCWDGMWSFEAERLGAAEVVATDIHSQRSFSEQGCSTFQFAKKHLRSNVKYKEASVYELDKYFEDEFDIVLFFGVLYHLRYPQLGIAKIRNTLKTEGLLLMETAVLVNTDDTIVQTDHKKIYASDRSTWNAYSIPALRLLLEESYLVPSWDKTIVEPDNEPNIGRAFVLARAFSGENGLHYFPDPFLEKFFEKMD